MTIDPSFFQQLFLSSMKDCLPAFGYVLLGTSGFYLMDHCKKIPEFGPYNLRMHTFVQGKSGTGKTTFLINLALEMIQKGYGMLWLDTHDQAWELLSRIPEEFQDRVIFIRPQDDYKVVPINLLQSFTKSPVEIEQLAGEFVAIMKKANTSSWGSNIESIVYDAVLGVSYARYCDPDNFKDITTLDVERVITNEHFRNKVIKANTLNPIVNAGLNDFSEIMSDHSLRSAVNKFRAWLRNTYLMHFLCSPEGINLKEEINKGKIIICNFDSSPVELGEINSQAISSIMVSKLKQVINTRKYTDKFFLCIFDEFQTYAQNESFVQMVTECRKKNVGLVLACQSLDGQLASRNPLISSAMDQCANQIYYRLGLEDASRASKLFSDDRKKKMKGKNYEDRFSPTAFNKLPNYWAISMRLTPRGSIFIHKGKNPDVPAGDRVRAMRIKKLSDKNHAKSRSDLKAKSFKPIIGSDLSWGE